jgi:hypothetical protein
MGKDHGVIPQSTMSATRVLNEGVNVPEAIAG